MTEVSENMNETADTPHLIRIDPSWSDCDFASSSLSDRVKDAVAKVGWKTPTDVQRMCLPYSIEGRDVAGFAQTGTGKTGVFLITIAERLLLSEQAQSRSDCTPEAIILCPTRELAIQIDNDAQELFKPLGINSASVYGGVDIDKQVKKIGEDVRVIVATTGRLKDLIKRKKIDMAQCGIFVCDEADRMFDMGFIEDVEFVLRKIPEDAHKMLFSATTNEDVKELAFEYLNQPEFLSVHPEEITPDRIEQHGIICDANMKFRVLLGLLQDHNPGCAIIFTNTKLTAEWLQYKLNKNKIETDVITGDLAQNKRIALIKKIKAGNLKILIATDVMSRGLHISGVTHVYNFDLPEEAANYVHRIGRTARAGAKGTAYTLVCDDYGRNLVEVNELLGEENKISPKWYDKRYETIEDISGNPFDDPDFMRSPQSAAPDEHRRGDRPRRADGGDRKRPEGRDESSGRSGASGKGRGARKRPNDNQPRRKSPGGRRDEAGHKGKRARPAKEGQKPQAAVAKPKSTGLIGLAKKIFKVFGK